MASIISVPYTVFRDNGITLANPEDGPTATVRFKCLWSDVVQFGSDLLGTSVRSGNTIVRTTPFKYPGSANLYCKAITSVTGLGQTIPLPNIGIPWITKKYAVVDAVFKVPSYAFDNNGAFGQAWATVTFGTSGEFMTLPESTYRFSDGTPTNTPIGKVIPQMEITLKRHFMPYLPLTEVEGLIGKVNSATFTLAGTAFSAGSLLFMGGESELAADTLGTVTMDVSYKFMYRNPSWNYYLHPDRTTGFATVTDGSGNYPYSSGDFSTLP